MPRMKRTFGYIFYIFLTLASISITSVLAQEEQPSIGQKTYETQTVDLFQYAIEIKKAVLRALEKNGYDHNVLSFETEYLEGYKNENCEEPYCRIFNPEGGEIAYRIPSADWLDSVYKDHPLFGKWIFTGSLCIGSDKKNLPQQCDKDGQDNEELVAILPWVKKDLCEVINSQVDLLTDTGAVPEVAQELNPGRLTRFTGSYGDGFRLYSKAAEENIFRKWPTGCFAIPPQSAVGEGEKKAPENAEEEREKPPSSYHFYHILIFTSDGPAEDL